MSRRRLSISTLWSFIVLLAALGVTASVLRAWGVFDSVFLSEGEVPEMSRIDRANLRALNELLAIEPGTALYEDGEEQNRRFLGKFNSNPGATLLHVMPAALFMILAPIQFVARLRSRHPAWHRWSGRFLVALAVPIAISGFYFGILMPFSGLLESSGIALFGTLFLVAAIRGFGAIRAGDVVRHRAWMIRMVAVALGVSSVRIIGMLLAVLLREGPDIWFGPSVWLGFGLTVVAAELWIRRTSPRKKRATPLGPTLPPPASLPAPEPSIGG
ncbi:MAG: DUF2306 domain-containing protein [Acidobacteria bacterium]|nr:DUF2306 domain-containing protein [Acidobacteriota bacterium]